MSNKKDILNHDNDHSSTHNKHCDYYESPKAFATIYKAKLRSMTSIFSNMKMIPIILLLWLFTTGFVGQFLYRHDFQFESFYILLLIIDTLIFFHITSFLKRTCLMLKYQGMKMKYLESKLGIDCSTIHKHFASANITNGNEECCNNTKECKTGQENTDNVDNKCNSYHNKKCCKHYPVWLGCTLMFFLIYGSAIWLSCCAISSMFGYGEM